MKWALDWASSLFLPTGFFLQPVVVVERVLPPLRLLNLSGVHSSLSCCFLLFLFSAAATVTLLFTSLFWGATPTSAFIGWSSFYVTTTQLDVWQVWFPVSRLQLCVGRVVTRVLEVLNLSRQSGLVTHSDLGEGGLQRLGCLKPSRVNKLLHKTHGSAQESLNVHSHLSAGDPTRTTTPTTPMTGANSLLLTLHIIVFAFCPWPVR